MRTTPEGGSVPVNAGSQRDATHIALSTTWQNMCQATIDCDGGKPVLLMFSFLIKNDSGAQRTYAARVLMDGFQLGDEIACVLNQNVTAGAQLPVSFHSWAPALPKGSHTFTFQLKSSANEDGQVCSEKRITVVEF